MQNFLATFQTLKQSFISAFSICMTVPLKPNLRKKRSLTWQYWLWKLPVLILGWNITKRTMKISDYSPMLKNRKVIAVCMPLYHLLFQFWLFLIFNIELDSENIKFYEHGSVRMKLQSFPLSWVWSLAHSFLKLKKILKLYDFDSVVWQRIKTLKIVFIMAEPMAMNFPLGNNK